MAGFRSFQDVLRTAGLPACPGRKYIKKSRDKTCHGSLFGFYGMCPQLFRPGAALCDAPSWRGHPLPAEAPPCNRLLRKHFLFDLLDLPAERLVGFDQVRYGLARVEHRGVVAASDGGPDGRERCLGV